MWKVLLAVAIWSSLGLLASLIFRRQGHNFLLFAGLGLWLGPFVILIMRSVSREQQLKVQVLREGAMSDGWIDVLVGVDGSPESVASVELVIAMLAPAIRRIRIVSALDRETANAPLAFDTDNALELELRAASHAFGFDGAELAFVTGRADHALVSHAIEEGFDLIVVSCRHHRLRSRLLGSTVERLARNSGVPVLIGSEGMRVSDRMESRRAARQ